MPKDNSPESEKFVPMPLSRLREISLKIMRTLMRTKGAINKLPEDQFALCIGITLTEYRHYIATLVFEDAHPEYAPVTMSEFRLGQLSAGLLRIFLRDIKPHDEFDLDEILSELGATVGELYECFTILDANFDADDPSDEIIDAEILSNEEAEVETLHIGSICPSCAASQLVGVGFGKLLCVRCKKHFPIG